MDEELLESAEVLEDTAADVMEEPVSENNIPSDFVEIARKYKAHESLTDEELDYIADTAL